MKTIAVKEKPILFSGALIPPIISEEKTVTRRVVKPQPKLELHADIGVELWKTRNGWGNYEAMQLEIEEEYRGYGAVGDQLWVRETWSYFGGDEYLYQRDRSNVVYCADFHNDPRSREWQCPRWRPSIHMPRWASRLTLEIVSVSVERLQEITEEDARAEGVMSFDTDTMQDAVRAAAARGQKSATAVDYFRWKWDALNSARGYSWESDPWVWRIEFKKLSP